MKIGHKELKPLAKVKFSSEYDPNKATRRIVLYGRHDVAPKFSNEIAKHLDDVDKLSKEIASINAQMEMFEESKLDVLEAFVNDDKSISDNPELEANLKVISDKINELDKKKQLKQTLIKTLQQKMNTLQAQEEQHYKSAYISGMNKHTDDMKAQITKVYNKFIKIHADLITLAETATRGRFCSEKLRYGIPENDKFDAVRLEAVALIDQINYLTDLWDAKLHMNLEYEKYTL